VNKYVSYGASPRAAIAIAERLVVTPWWPDDECWF